MTRARGSGPSILEVASTAGALLACALSGLACARAGSELRRYTYPPGFDYITSQEIEGTMWQIAVLVERLDEILENDDVANAHRVEIRQILTALESASDELKAEGSSSNHPALSQNLDRFRSDIRRARLGVEHDPPSYLRASAIPGACVYCHEG